MTLRQLCDLWGMTELDAAQRILDEEGANAVVVTEMMNEEDVRTGYRAKSLVVAKSKWKFRSRPRVESGLVSCEMRFRINEVRVMGLAENGCDPTHPMVEHEPWKGPDYEAGINGLRIAIMGHSHHGGGDTKSFTLDVMSDVISGRQSYRFFNLIRDYFEVQETWFSCVVG